MDFRFESPPPFAVDRSACSFVFKPDHLDEVDYEKPFEVYTYNASTGVVTFDEYYLTLDQVTDYCRYEMHLMRSEDGSAAYAEVAKFRLETSQ